MLKCCLFINSRSTRLLPIKNINIPYLCNVKHFVPPFWKIAVMLSPHRNYMRPLPTHSLCQKEPFVHKAQYFMILHISCSMASTRRLQLQISDCWSLTPCSQSVCLVWQKNSCVCCYWTCSWRDQTLQATRWPSPCSTCCTTPGCRTGWPKR